MKLDECIRNNESDGMDTKFTVESVGLQKSTSTQEKIWVLNDKIHINERGKVVDPTSTGYLWFGVDRDLGSAATMQEGKRHVPVKNLILSLKRCYGKNFPATLLTLGAQVMSLHYEMILEKEGQVPAAILFGEIALGKTCVTKAALSLLGVQEANFITCITDRKAHQLTARTTLGIVIDDPTDPQEVADKILHHFNQGKAQSCSATYSPRCTFITSVNMEFLKKLASMHPK